MIIIIYDDSMEAITRRQYGENMVITSVKTRNTGSTM